MESTLFVSAKLDELFRICDTNCRGVIGRQEFGQLCEKFGISENDADVIFKDLDYDEDGEINFEDFSYGFRDYLTPGTRRGSLQIPVVNDGAPGNSLQAYYQQLQDMERKHASAQKAWKQLTANVGIPCFQKTKVLDKIKEEDGEVRALNLGASKQMQDVLMSLVREVQHLHEEYRTLETSVRREREVHAAQIAALGEELDSQLANAEIKAKLEMQQQLEVERKKVTSELECKISELTTQLMNFKKVDEWLSQEESRKANQVRELEKISKLQNAELENRDLRNALAEAQMKASLLQTHLTQKRNEYMDLRNEFQSEKKAASEYRSQVELMHNHLSILSHANQVLSDANDCFSMSNVTQQPSDCGEDPSEPSSLQSNHSFGRNPARSPDSMCNQSAVEVSQDDFDADSGRGTLEDELRAAGTRSDNTTKPSSKNEIAADDNANNNLLSSKVQRTFKVILAGDAAVGKSTFIDRVCNGQFTPNLSSTIGVDFRVKTLTVDGESIHLQLWDTAGQERFRSLTQSYFRRADGVILMYDVTNEQTFLSTRSWLQNIQDTAGRNIPVIMCGNKVDLRSEGLEGVSATNGQKVAVEYGIMFAETSPKSGQNVLYALTALSREMSTFEDKELKDSVSLFKDSSENQKSCCLGSVK